MSVVPKNELDVMRVARQRNPNYYDQDHIGFINSYSLHETSAALTPEDLYFHDRIMEKWGASLAARYLVSKPGSAHYDEAITLYSLSGIHYEIDGKRTFQELQKSYQGEDL